MSTPAKERRKRVKPSPNIWSTWTTNGQSGKQHVTITLPADVAELILQQAAYDVALYSARLDYITERTADRPGTCSVVNVKRAVNMGG